VFLAIGGFFYVYKLSERVRLGLAADSDFSYRRMLHPTTRSPGRRQLRYGTSIQYQISRDITAGAAREFMDAGPAPYKTRCGPLAGTLQEHYSTDYLNFVALNLI
jgi:hypothetical protein